MKKGDTLRGGVEMKASAEEQPRNTGTRRVPRRSPAQRRPRASVATKATARGHGTTKKTTLSPAAKHGLQHLFEVAAEKGMPYFPFGPPVLDE
jgi:hypothetical protein